MSAPSPPPPAAALARARHAGQELVLLLGALVLAFWLAALLGYAAQDPGWSTTGSGAPVVNRMGRVGAWLADVSYFFFGFSVWWLPLAAGRAWLGYFLRWLHAAPGRADSAAQAGWHAARLGAALALLLAASCALEWARLHRLDPWLPGPSGGVCGALLGQWVQQWLGPDGTVLTGIGALLAAVAWVFGFSWARVAERLGALLDGGWRAAAPSAAVQVARDSARVEPDGDWLALDAPDAAGAAPADAPPPLAARAPAAAKTCPPPLTLLEAGASAPGTDHEAQHAWARMIETRLKSYGVAVQVQDIVSGPVVTRYDITLADGVLGSAVTRVAKDLARSLGLASIRILESVPEKNCMGLELPNCQRQGIVLRQILESDAWQQCASSLALALGQDSAGRAVLADLREMPHLLVAGRTGSGKSVGLHAMIVSLLYRADARHVRLLLIDPKMNEFSPYAGIAHLLCPVVTDMVQAARALAWCVQEMQRRYQLLGQCGANNLAAYNAAQPGARLPYIVVVIDELADLMATIGKAAEEPLARLAQKSRAAGIHLILATQRPSVKVITGEIKANIPARLAFAVSSRTDSAIVLDRTGAEALLGQGDALYLGIGAGQPQRVHGAFVSAEEVARVAAHWRAGTTPDYVPGVLDEDPASATGESNTL